MKFTKSLKMIPLVIGISSNVHAYQNTNFSFNEDDIKNNLIKVDSKTLQYSKQQQELLFDQQYLKIRFQNYLSNWRNETAWSSNVSEIISHKSFEQIVLMDKKAIPLILNELKSNPSNLVWALNFILDKKISNSDLTIESASNLWVTWGRNSQLI